MTVRCRGRESSKDKTCLIRVQAGYLSVCGQLAVTSGATSRGGGTGAAAAGSQLSRWDCLNFRALEFFGR